MLGQIEYTKFLSIVPNVIMLGVGGSHAHGTSTKDSDIDIRGIFINSETELLGITSPLNHFVDKDTDTVLYSLKKCLYLFMKCNPNVIEFLGLRPDDYLYRESAFDRLVKNKDLFLSKTAIQTFTGFTYNILHRINNGGSAKKGKEMMNLLYGYMLGIEILNKGDVHAYRGGYEHSLLMDMRNNKYLEEDLITPKKEFWNIVEEYKKKFNEAIVNTTLPDKPDIEGVNRLSVELHKEYWR